MDENSLRPHWNLLSNLSHANCLEVRLLILNVRASCLERWLWIGCSAISAATPWLWSRGHGYVYRWLPWKDHIKNCDSHPGPKRNELKGLPNLQKKWSRHNSFNVRDKCSFHALTTVWKSFDDMARSCPLATEDPSGPDVLHLQLPLFHFLNQKRIGQLHSMVMFIFEVSFGHPCLGIMLHGTMVQWYTPFRSLQPAPVFWSQQVWTNDASRHVLAFRIRASKIPTCEEKAAEWMTLLSALWYDRTICERVVKHHKNADLHPSTTTNAAW